MTVIESDTAGTVWKILVAEGQQVSDGDTLVIVESMKMEIPFESEGSGVVQVIHVAEGDVIADGDALITLGA